MRKLLKAIGIITILSGVIGVVYSVFQAIRMKREEDITSEFPDADEVHITRNCIFDGIKETIDISKTKQIDLTTRFGGVSLTLEDVDAIGGDLNLYVDCSFGGVEIMLPRAYNINSVCKVFIGGIEWPTDDVSENNPTLTISGRICVGGLSIGYYEEDEAERE